MGRGVPIYLKEKFQKQFRSDFLGLENATFCKTWILVKLPKNYPWLPVSAVKLRHEGIQSHFQFSYHETNYDS